MSKQRIDVFISSTSIDLPEYRTAVRDAILSLGLFPSGMEHWPVSGENPVDLCRNMVFDAEIYLGIYAHRYGWQPDGYDGKSITELEYDWASEVRRDGKPIPRLCFIMADSHPWPKDKMERDSESALNQFKARVKENQVGFFTTADNLKAQVTAALAPFAARAGLNTALPYLRWLHDQSKKSGLLHVLNPRDASSSARPITVEQVYTPLDTRLTVFRDQQGKLIIEDAQGSLQSIEKMQEARDRLRHAGETKSSRLTAMEAANLNARLVLLGDPGSGKSTFVNFLALCLTGHLIDPDGGWLRRLEEQGWEHGEKLPVVVTLRDFAQDVQSGEGTAALLFDHIERQLMKWKLEAAFPALLAALETGRALVLLDGLDEVPGEKRDMVRGAVSDFMTRCHADNRLIITCRILSYSSPEWQIPSVPSETIAPFDGEKVAHFVQTWYAAMKALGGIDPELAQKRVADLTEGLRHTHLQDIATNPMLLTVMAVVHNHTGTLPRESARLYDECVRLLMLRWRPHEARSLLETLDVREDDLYRLLWEIAYDAHDKQAEREGAADIAEAAVLGIARKRLGDMTKAAEFCEYVEKHAGLLIGRGQDAYGLRVFTFPHRTFQEYLAGCHVASDRFTRRAPELARRGAGWREALMLATGHLLFNDRRTDIPLDAVNAMCPERLRPQTDEEWRAIWLAGDMLVLIGLTNVENDDIGRDVLPRVRGRLADLLNGGHLPPVERAAAGQTLANLGDSRFGVGVKDGIPEIDWCEVPAGKFQMGSDDAPYDDEKPQHEVDILYSYRISRYPITQTQFQAFLDDHGVETDRWWVGMPEKDKDSLDQEYAVRKISGSYFQYPNHPRERVSWYQVVAFCRWLSVKLGYEVRLPTEAEWEKAARGTDGRIYPYGNDFDARKGNTGELGIGQTSAVGIFPNPELPYGVLDMSGNVLEWCLTKWRNSYAEVEDNSVDDSGEARVLRGGSWGVIQGIARAASRSGYHPVDRDFDVGFRVVCRPPSLGL